MFVMVMVVKKEMVSVSTSSGIRCTIQHDDIIDSRQVVNLPHPATKARLTHSRFKS